jgi:hypothetical protein
LKDIIFHGNLGKYQSDIVLVDALLNTENAVLVEASPYDGIYGVGLTDGDLLNPNGTLKVMPENWKNPKDGTQATNHLGFVLMGIRDLFRELMGHSWRPGEEYTRPCSFTFCATIRVSLIDFWLLYIKISKRVERILNKAEIFISTGKQYGD